MVFYILTQEIKGNKLTFHLSQGISSKSYVYGLTVTESDKFVFVVIVGSSKNSVSPIFLYSDPTAQWTVGIL